MEVGFTYFCSFRLINGNINLPWFSLSCFISMPLCLFLIQLLPKRNIQKKQKKTCNKTAAFPFFHLNSTFTVFKVTSPMYHRHPKPSPKRPFQSPLCMAKGMVIARWPTWPRPLTLPDTPSLPFPTDGPTRGRPLLLVEILKGVFFAVVGCVVS